MKLKHGPPLAKLALFLLPLAVAPLADAGPLFFYKLTPVADTLGGFPYQSLNGFPSINGSGRVAFIATLTGGNQAVLSRRGTSGPNTLSDIASGPYFGYGITTSINPVNTILFVGLKHGNDEVLIDLVRGEGNSATKLITIPGDRAQSICGGTQINVQKTVVFTAERSNGTKAILAVGAGDLTGVVRVIAEEGSEFSSLGCSPSIGFDGTVAFLATRNGHRAIFTRGPPPQNPLTQIIDDTGPFFSFTDVAFNQQGGVAFGARFSNGARTVQRIKDGALIKIGDTNIIGGALAINESGVVVFEVIDAFGAPTIFRGPGGLFGRVVGPGSVVQGRTVAAAHIDRDSLNSLGQIAVLLTFFDGTQMIARGDPVRSDIVVDLSALQLATAGALSVSAGTPLPTPSVNSLLTFDVAFLSPHGELTVKLNDAVLDSIAATEPGVRRRISLPLDRRVPGKYRLLGRNGELRFVLDGKPGASVQISNVSIPGLFSDRMDADSAPRWQIDAPRGGSADFVSIARLPVKIRLTSLGNARGSKPVAELVRAAVLSTEDLDATTDLDRSSLRLDGFPARTTPDKAGKQQLACDDARDVDGDKRKDLVCEIEVKSPGKARGKTELRLEAMTQFGWGITGSDVLAAAGGAK